MEKEAVKVLGIVNYWSENDPRLGIWPTFYLKIDTVALFPLPTNGTD